MAKRLWTIVLPLQIAGLLCLSGGESFAITRIGFACRVFALIALEPRLILTQGLVERILWGFSFTVAQMHWMAILAAIGFNIFFYSSVY